MKLVRPPLCATLSSCHKDRFPSLGDWELLKIPTPPEDPQKPVLAISASTASNELTDVWLFARWNIITKFSGIIGKSRAGAVLQKLNSLVEREGERDDKVSELAGFGHVCTEPWRLPMEPRLHFAPWRRQVRPEAPSGGRHDRAEAGREGERGREGD